jgi:orotidine-5'-phosphate decarboxylase
VTFGEALSQARERSGLFCVGIDPSPSLLQSWGLPVDEAGLREMVFTLIEVSQGLVSVVKPQSAYFEAFGAAGIESLRDAVRLAHREGLMVIADCKRGDIGETTRRYAEAVLGPESYLGADAMTLHPYCGFESLLPAIRHAEAVGAGTFVVVRSSNPGATALQEARYPDGRTVAGALLDDIDRTNEGGGPIGSTGVVLGATLQPDTVRELMASRRSVAPILAPGIGAQGARISGLTGVFGTAVQRVIPTASRSVIEAGPERRTLRDAIGNCAAESKALAGQLA